MRRLIVDVIRIGRKDHRGVDLISDVLPLWYLEVDDAIGYAKRRSRAHDAIIRVYDAAVNVIATHEHAGDFNVTELLRELEQEMQEASANLEFERAALLRDQIMEVKSGAGISKIEPKRRLIKYTRNAGRRRSRL